jgi:hypothetical protein
MDANITQQTLDLIHKSYSGDGQNINAHPLLQKGWTAPATATTGINFYDLEAPSKLLYPVITPLRNMIPRVKAEGGTQANWRAVIAIDPNFVPDGVSEGNRAGEMTQTTRDYIAVYRKMGKESQVTVEAEYSAKGFEDLLALNSMQLLRATMISEEFNILWSLGSFALPRTPQPAGTPAITAGGALTVGDSPYTIYCIALTADGYRRANMTTGVVQALVTASSGPYANNDTTGGGSAQVSIVSANISMTVSPATNSIIATVTAVPGAAGYAWYIGKTSSPAAARLYAITTVNTCTILTMPTTTQLYSALNNTLDYSQNAFQWDGLIPQCIRTAAVNPTYGGGYYVSNDGAALTADGNGGITQFDTALQWFWDNYRLSPDVIYVSSQEMKSIRRLILSTTVNSMSRFVFNVEQGQLKGGSMVISYLNPFCMNAEAEEIPIKLHPQMVPGTVFFLTTVLPYPLSNVTNVFQMKLRYDYWQFTWPMNRMSREFGIYYDGVLQHFFPPSMGVIANIAPS